MNFDCCFDDFHSLVKENAAIPTYSFLASNIDNILRAIYCDCRKASKYGFSKGYGTPCTLMNLESSANLVFPATKLCWCNLVAFINTWRRDRINLVPDLMCLPSHKFSSWSDLWSSKLRGCVAHPSLAAWWIDVYFIIPFPASTPGFIRPRILHPLILHRKVNVIWWVDSETSPCSTFQYLL